MPFLVFLLLDHLDPVVGDSHGEAIVEAESAVFEFHGEAGHAAHLLGDGDGFGVDFVDEDVGQGEIDDGVGVLAAVVIVGVAAERLAEAVVVIEHRGDAVEAEAVELVFLKPELAVGEEEMEHRVLAVVEEEGIPGGMFAAVVAVEVEVVAAVDAAEALDFVFHGVGMHEVHDHGDAELMAFVDEALEVVGSAEARRGGVEAADVIAEGAVVGVLLDGHELDGVVAVFGDAGKDVESEFLECADALLILGHADVGLVDEERLGVGSETLHLEFVGILGGVDFGGEYLGVGILHHAAGVGRDPFSFAPVPEHAHFEEVAVMKHVGVEFPLPGAVVKTLERISLVVFPVGEGAGE